MPRKRYGSTFPGPAEGSSSDAAAQPEQPKPEVQRLLSVIKASMKALGFTNRDVERQLGLSGSYLSRLFSGMIELRVEHVVDIARAIGLEPEVIFQVTFPRKAQPMSAAAARVREVLGEPDEPAGDEVASELEKTLEKMMARTLQKLLGRLG